MSKSAWFLAVCFVVLLVCSGILFDSLTDFTESKPLSPKRRRHASSISKFETHPENYNPNSTSEDSQDPPDQKSEPRELAIQGRVVGPDMKPLNGAKLVLAPSEEEKESASIAGLGSFNFSSALRQGTSALQLEMNGAPRSYWPQVVVGDLKQSPYDPSRLVYAWDIHWSLTICNEDALKRRVQVASTSDENPEEGGESSISSTTREIPNSNLPKLNYLNSQSLSAGKYLSIDSVLVEDWGASGVAHIEGRSLLPDGLHVYSAIYFLEDRLIASLEPGEIQGGRYRVAIPFPEEFHLYSNVYQVRVSFSPHQEDLDLLEEVKKKDKKIDWEALERKPYEARALFGVGTPQEEHDDDLKVAAYYRQVLDEVGALRKVFFSRYGETRKLSKGWNPQLKKLALESTGLGPQGLSIGEEGGFDEADWRKFVDEFWRPKVKTLLDRHARITMEKFPRATGRFNRLLNGLIELSCLYSQDLYQKYNLEKHASDFPNPTNSLDVGLSFLSKLIGDDIVFLSDYTDIKTLPRHLHPGWRKGGTPEDQTNKKKKGMFR